jgi:hypothetical protein|tara:strand:- start:56 stop:523 length:468 start_codon:yes stop_codon:yes gene_type:complete
LSKIRRGEAERSVEANAAPFIDMTEIINVQPTWEELLPVLVDNYKRAGSPHESNVQYKPLLDMARLLDGAVVLQTANEQQEATIAVQRCRSDRLEVKHINQAKEIESLQYQRAALLSQVEDLKAKLMAKMPPSKPYECDSYDKAEGLDYPTDQTE